MNKLLVTTALVETWGTDEEIVFLGEWCKLYGDDSNWENRKTSVLYYHWSDRKKAQNDFFYIDSLYRRLLKSISINLNEHFSVNYSEREWTLIIGYWLFQFIVVVFDRWSCVLNAIEQNNSLETITFDYDKSDFVPKSTSDACNCFVDDAWNHVLILDIINYFPSIKIKKNNLYKNTKHLEYKKKSHKITLLWHSLKKNLFNKLSSLKNLLIDTTNNNQYIFVSFSLNFWSFIKLIFLLKGRFYYEPLPVKHKIIYPKNDLPNLTNSFVSKNYFEQSLKHLVKDWFPVCFKSLILADGITSSPISNSSHNYLLTTSSHFTDDFFKQWAAQQVHNGSKIIIGAHGGGPFHLYNGATHLEFLIADRYLAPGKYIKTNSTVVNCGQYWHRLKYGSWNSSGFISIITGLMPRYTSDLRSMAISSLMLNYFEDLFSFYGNLSPEVSKSTRVRIYPKGDYGWRQKRRWQDRYRNIKFSPINTSYKQLVSKSRLIVATYNCTTYCETLAANIPTLIFWDVNFWQMDTSSIEYFEILKDVGIFHTNATSAAGYVNEISQDVLSWWQDSNRQNARKEFCEKYAHRSKNQILELSNGIKILN